MITLFDPRMIFLKTIDCVCCMKGAQLKKENDIFQIPFTTFYKLLSRKHKQWYFDPIASVLLKSEFLSHRHWKTHLQIFSLPSAVVWRQGGAGRPNRPVFNNVECCQTNEQLCHTYPTLTHIKRLWEARKNMQLFPLISLSFAFLVWCLPLFDIKQVVKMR